MAYSIEAEPGEKVLLDLDFQVSARPSAGFTAGSRALARESNKRERLRLGVSDRALYLPATRFVVSGDPFYFRRVPREQVHEIRVQRLRPYGLWIAAAVMVAAGLIVEILMMTPLVTQSPGTYQVSGWPLAILVGGLLLPIAGRGRSRLVIQMAKGRFGWNSPLVIDRASKQRIAAALDEVLKACRGADLQVSDERALASAGAS